MTTILNKEYRHMNHVAPSMRMQRGAATRPRDQADFGAQFLLDWHPDLLARRSSAPSVRPH